MLHTLFFMSGVSGLVYQIVWVRQFGNLFGNTVYSASLVTAVFMLGLGLGSWWLGRRSDRVSAADPARNVRDYGWLEIAVGGLGLLLALAFPLIEGASGAIATYVEGEHGWYELSLHSQLFKYALAALLILPSTFLMGGTLPLLIRYRLHGDLTGAASKVGGLYGANTLGAACGALLVDFFLVPQVGLLRSQAIACVVNVAAGICALALARSFSGARERVAAAPAPPGAPDRGSRIFAVVAAIFVAGFLGMGLEIIWFRFLTGIVGSYRMVFSLLLFVILVGMWVGAWVGGRLARSGEGARRLFVNAQCLIVLTGLVGLFFFDPRWQYSDALVSAYVTSSSTWLRTGIEILYQAQVFAFIALIPAIYMGMSFPLANAIIQDAQRSIGARAGGLYLANTSGGVLGSLVVGFVLIPGMGMQSSLLLVSGLGCVGALLLHWDGRLDRSPSRERPWLPAVASAAVIALAVLAPSNALLVKMFTKNESRNAHIKAVSEGPNEVLAVAEGEHGELLLLTNGHKMSGTAWSDQRYMGAFSHIPLLQIDAPESALVICFGVGTTLYSASLHDGIERLDVVDLSKNVLSHHRWFEAFNHRVLDDPRVRVHVNDGRQHLRMQGDDAVQYDLITLEPPPLRYAGISSLYSREFYALAHARLREGGFMTQWLPINQIPEEVALALVRAFIEVFPESLLLNGYDDSLMLMGRKGRSIALDLERFERNLEARPAVAAHMEEIQLGSMLEVAGSFVSSVEALRDATAHVEAMSDDRPTMEYSHIAFVDHKIPESLFNVETIASWCHDCMSPELSSYLSLQDAWYRTRQYVHRSSVEPIRPEPLRVVDRGGRVRSVVRDSAYWRRMLDPRVGLLVAAPRVPKRSPERGAISTGPARAGSSEAFAHELR